MKATISNTALTRKSLINAAGISLFLFFTGFFVANFASPVLAYEMPFCTVTGGYSVCTDQADYAPTFIVHIAGSGFVSDSSYLIKVTRPGGSVVTGDGSFGPWPSYYDTALTDSNGNFQFDYILDGITGEYKIEVLDLGNNVLATHLFTDGPKIVSATSNPTSRTIDCGTSSTTYTIDVTRGSGNGATGATLSIVGNTAIAARASFNPNPISFPSGQPDITKDSTLTIALTSPSQLSAGIYTFKVHASRTDQTQDNDNAETGTITLTINSCPPPAPLCGNGNVDSGEVCDGGSQSCTTGDGYAGTQSCLNDCSGWDTCVATEYCGDGTVNGNEVCDDGANNGQPNHCNAQCTGTTTPVCGNGVLESGEQCESPFDSCCDQSTCQFKSSSTVCRAADGICDLAETCTGTSADCPSDLKSNALCRQATDVCDVDEVCDGVNNDCPTDTKAPLSTPCDDGQYCSATDHCDGQGSCVQLTVRDCSIYNLPEIATCANDPDNNPFTWDSRAAFTSTCDETADSCTNGNAITITHTGNDNDGDGYASNCGDCNDNNAAIHPGATEICDGVDNDCSTQTSDGSAESWYNQQTSCGLGVCSATGNFVCQTGVKTDTCAVGQPTGQDNNCNGIDENCDGTADNNYAPVTSCFLPGVCAAGNVASTCVAGTETACTTGTPTTESCNGLDDDCDGSTDESLTRATTCGVGACSGNTGIETCTAGAWGGDTCNPFAGATAETCDNVDNNCNGFVDDGLTPPLCENQQGVCAGSTKTCGGVSGWLACDASRYGAYYEATNEATCDGKDNDCDGSIDEGVKLTFYQDSDSDNYGNNAVTQQACTAPTGYVIDNTDCDDNDNVKFPGNTEACDRKDNNCNLIVDENDQLVPTTTSNVSTEWKNSDVTVTLTPSDNGVCGVQATYYCVDQAGTCIPNTLGTSVSVTAEGINYVRYLSIDNSGYGPGYLTLTYGNVEAVKSDIVNIDKTAPTCSIIEPLKDSYLHGTASIKLSASDSESGISKVEWSKDNLIWNTTTFDGTFYSADWNTTGIKDGIYTIYGKATDNAGLVTYDPVNVVVDNKPPVITIVSPENITYSSSSVGLTFTVNEPTSSVVYSLDGATNVPATNTTLTGLSDKSHTLTIRATDLAGNQNTATIVFTVSVPPAPEPPAQTSSGGGGIAPSASIDSSNILTNKPTAESQVIVQNGRATLWNPSIFVDSVCSEEIIPKSLNVLNPSQSASFAVNFDCKGVAYGEYPVTYSLQLPSGRIIASKTYTLTISESGVSVPNVVILSATSTALTPGETGTISVTVQNSGDAGTNGNVSLNSKNGFSVSPLNIPISLQPGEQKSISFKITSSDNAGLPTGNDALTGFASLIGINLPSTEKIDVLVDYETHDGTNSVGKAIDVTINPRFPYFLIILFVSLAAGFYYFYFCRRKKREEESK